MDTARREIGGEGRRTEERYASQEPTAISNSYVARSEVPLTYLLKHRIQKVKKPRKSVNFGSERNSNQGLEDGRHGGGRRITLLTYRDPLK